MCAELASVSGVEKAAYAAVGVIVGFLLNELRSFLLRRRKHSAYWTALYTEIEYARGRAQMYLDDNIMAPLYRLPTSAFETCYPELLADGVLTEANTTALMAFFSEVETFNRGLDRVGATDDEKAIEREYSRNRLKAQQLISTGALYMAATAIVRPHAKQSRS